MSLAATYERLKVYVPRGKQIDSFDVVKQVEEYRQWWRPKQPGVYLLGESHVATNEEDFNSEITRYQKDLIPNYPTHFVRAVYCLGSGEKALFDRVPKNNSGTWQFWRIFSSCISSSCNDLGFSKIVKKGTPNTYRRILNKVNILKEMQRKGIWLMDASIIGIAGNKKSYGWKMSRDVKDNIIKTCWDSYILNQILEDKPKHIIVIGIGVEKTLAWRLQLLNTKTGITHSALPQPQGDRRSSDEQLETYRDYQRICSRILTHQK